MSYSLEEKKETRLLKNMKRRRKREAVKLRRAKDQKQAEVEKMVETSGRLQFSCLIYWLRASPQNDLIIVNYDVVVRYF